MLELVSKSLFNETRNKNNRHENKIVVIFVSLCAMSGSEE